ncbi:MAG: adenylate cyclase [Acidimicrobiales bacterium]
MAGTAITDSPERLGELLALMKGSDTVELKLTIPNSNRRVAARALGVDPLEAEIRQVFFFDTPDLALNRAGVVARARRVAKGDDSVVKLRPVVPAELSPALRASPNVGVEVDAMPGGFVCSASCKAKLGVGTVKTVLGAGKSIKKLFTKEQRALFKAHAPAEITMDSLAVLGPINVLKLRFVPAGFDRRLVGELWLYPDASSVLELSTKCLPAEAFDVAAQARAFLHERGVDLQGEQQTKTAKALRFFASELEVAAR